MYSCMLDLGVMNGLTQNLSDVFFFILCQPITWLHPPVMHFMTWAKTKLFKRVAKYFFSDKDSEIKKNHQKSEPGNLFQELPPSKFNVSRQFITNATHDQLSFLLNRIRYC